MKRMQLQVIVCLLTINFSLVGIACDELQSSDTPESEETEDNHEVRLVNWIESEAGSGFAFVPVNRVGGPSEDLAQGDEEAALWPADMELISEQPDDPPEPLTGGTGWHYTTWPATGFRPYNPSGCGGTKYCTFGPGTWVRWEGSMGTCGSEPWDAYVHDTPCGSGWVRADALN